jgi:uncharacterized protein YqgV (UPF0045/DUF77 family)
MTIASAQISTYPLRQDRLSPAIEAVRVALLAHGLSANIGSMSTIVVGQGAEIFAALATAFAAAAEMGQLVMTMTISNACPVAD